MSETASFFAFYRVPEDPEAFDANYFGSHVPLAEKVPGLIANRLHKVGRQLVGEPAYHLIAELVFESREARSAAFKTPEWAALGTNLEEWGGMDLVTMLTTEPATH